MIGRAGASTCSELVVAGRPSILIPLKIAADDHQRFNAMFLSDAGGAEDVLTLGVFAKALAKLLSDPNRPTCMAAARSIAVPNAAEPLADLVERAAG